MGADERNARAATALDRYIGARIRGCRSAQELSQEKLAAAIGVTFQQVQKYERGANRVAAATLFRIAKELRVPIAELMPPIDPARNTNDGQTLRMLAQLTPSLSPDGQALLVNMARVLTRCRRLRG